MDDDDGLFDSGERGYIHVRTMVTPHIFVQVIQLIFPTTVLGHGYHNRDSTQSRSEGRTCSKSTPETRQLRSSNATSSEYHLQQLSNYSVELGPYFALPFPSSLSTWYLVARQSLSLYFS